MQNVIFVTTMWDKVKADAGQRLEEELQSHYWEEMLKLGSATTRFELTSNSAWAIIDRILDATPVP